MDSLLNEAIHLQNTSNILVLCLKSPVLRDADCKCDKLYDKLSQVINALPSLKKRNRVAIDFDWYGPTIFDSVCLKTTLAQEFTFDKYRVTLGTGKIGSVSTICVVLGWLYWTFSSFYRLARILKDFRKQENSVQPPLQTSEHVLSISIRSLIDYTIKQMGFLMLFENNFPYHYIHLLK